MNLHFGKDGPIWEMDLNGEFSHFLTIIVQSCTFQWFVDDQILILLVFFVGGSESSPEKIFFCPLTEIGDALLIN